MAEIRPLIELFFYIVVAAGLIWLLQLWLAAMGLRNEVRITLVFLFAVFAVYIILVLMGVF